MNLTFFWVTHFLVHKSINYNFKDTIMKKLWKNIISLVNVDKVRKIIDWGKANWWIARIFYFFSQTEISKEGRELNLYSVPLRCHHISKMIWNMFQIKHSYSNSWSDFWFSSWISLASNSTFSLPLMLHIVTNMFNLQNQILKLFENTHLGRGLKTLITKKTPKRPIKGR